MEVDHFNPTLKNAARHAYNNLMLAFRHCNGKKSDNWPSKKAMMAGVRFLNPCVEMDYGVHLFEDPKTWEIVGVTAAGRYHIDMLDLNAPIFVKQRRTRAELRAILEDKAFDANSISHEACASISNGIEGLKALVALMIPPLPCLSPSRA